MQLTKSNYVAGIQCAKQLWLKTNQGAARRAMSPAQRRTIKQGRKIGELARQEFRGGILVDSQGDDAVAETRRLIEGGSTTIFEAAFVAESTFIRCDVLVRTNEDRWTLIEVKSSTAAKPHHVHDLAIQHHVITHCGLEVERMVLMYVDRSHAVGEDYRPKFAMEDMTAQVHSIAAETSKNLKLMLAVMNSPTVPAIDVGAHCRSPQPCPFHDNCWSDLPDTSIQFLPRLTPKQRTELADRAIDEIDQLHAEIHLSRRQRRYVSCVMSGDKLIDYDAVREFLRSMVHPIHFFDFETYGSACPHVAGVRPYQQIPFQYSCHVLDAEGSLTHKDHLHETTSDPRPELIRALRRDVADHGSIVVYNAQFERKILQELAALFPSDAPFLHSMVHRLTDQLDVFRESYISPAFRGSNSLKRVLSAIAPEADYHNLAIQRGDDAQAIWSTMIQSSDGPQKRHTSADLRAYCQRDTYAMVLIHHHLNEIVASSGV